MNLLAGQEYRCRCRGQLWTQQGKERVGQVERVALQYIDYVCKTGNQPDVAVWGRELTLCSVTT